MKQRVIPILVFTVILLAMLACNGSDGQPPDYRNGRYSCPNGYTMTTMDNGMPWCAER